MSDSFLTLSSFPFLFFSPFRFDVFLFLCTSFIIFTAAFGRHRSPKGVLVEHVNMVVFAAAKARDERIGPGARVLLASTFTFDLCEVCGRLSTFVRLARFYF